MNIHGYPLMPMEICSFRGFCTFLVVLLDVPPFVGCDADADADDVEQCLRKMDARSDKLITSTETQEQRINILAKMASPENLRRDHMQMAEIVTHVQRLQKDCDRLYSMHNGTHPPVPSERTGK